jgi:hypothetical protein
MALRTSQITVGTTPVELSVKDIGGSSIIMQAPAASQMWVGDSTVTPTTGYPVPAGQALSMDLENERIYGVLASGSGTAYVMRTGVK